MLVPLPGAEVMFNLPPTIPNRSRKPRTSQVQFLYRPSPSAPKSTYVIPFQMGMYTGENLVGDGPAKTGQFIGPDIFRTLPP